jgi:hypothetical protein
MATQAFGQLLAAGACSLLEQVRPWQCWSKWEKNINSAYKVSVPCLEYSAPAPDACYSTHDLPVAGLKALNGEDALVPDPQTAFLLANVLVRRHFPAVLDIRSTVRFVGDAEKGGYWFVDGFLVGHPKKIGILISRQTGQVFVFGEALKRYSRSISRGFDG